MQLGLLEDALHTEVSTRVPGFPVKGLNIVGPQVEQEVWGPEASQVMVSGSSS